MVCAKCNARIADTARFCNKCGEKVDKSLGAGDTVTCPECKAAYPRTTKFCKKDGTRLDSGRLEPTTPPEESKEPLANEVISEKISPSPLSSPSRGEDASKSAAPPLRGGDEGAGVTKGLSINEAVELKTAVTENEIREEIKPDLPVEPLPEAAETPQFEPYQQPSAEDSMPKKPKSKMPLVFVLLGILVIGSGVGSYFYFSKKSTQTAAKASAPQPAEESKAAPETGKTEGKEATEKLPTPTQPEQRIKPGKLAKLINRDLKHKRLGSIRASVNHDMVVTLNGSADSPEEKASAINIAGMYKEAAEVKDNIHVKEKAKPYTASPEPKAPTAPKAPPTSQPPVKSVPKTQERPRINDPYLLAAEINRALKNAGLRFVTASVTDNFEIYLMGMVTSSSEREKALRIARSFREGRRVIDQMMNNY